MALFLSQALRYVTSRNSENYSDRKEAHETRSVVPIIASPVDPDAYFWLHKKRRTETKVPGRIKRSYTVAQFEAEQTESNLAGRIFRNSMQQAPWSFSSIYSSWRTWRSLLTTMLTWMLYVSLPFGS